MVSRHPAPVPEFHTCPTLPPLGKDAPCSRHLHLGWGQPRNGQLLPGKGGQGPVMMQLSSQDQESLPRPSPSVPHIPLPSVTLAGFHLLLLGAQLPGLQRLRMLLGECGGWLTWGAGTGVRSLEAGASPTLLSPILSLLLLVPQSCLPDTLQSVRFRAGLGAPLWLRTRVE